MSSPSFKDDDGRVRRRTKPKRVLLPIKYTLKVLKKLKSLRRTSFHRSGSSQSPPPIADSLLESAEPFPHLKGLVDSVNVLRQSAGYSDIQERQEIYHRSLEILDAVADENLDFSQAEICEKLTALTILFTDIHNCLTPRSTCVDLKDLKRQLDTAHSSFVMGNKSQALTRSKVKRFFSTFADVLTTVLRALDQSADAFPPLKSAVGGILACSNITKRVKSSKIRARELKEELTVTINALLSNPQITIDLSGLRSKIPQLDTIVQQSYTMRLKHLNHNEGVLMASESDLKRVHRLYQLLSASPRKKKRWKLPPIKSTSTYYGLFSISLAFF
ncbi:hypothetical protein VKT23_005514 [Stygiomarasmius scandens]|uniref:Uncharacterized protein n=1 Tax=Marasmiellus scandens TaxID=2682957 RepID=A0ABR1JW76_9AGAR